VTTTNSHILFLARVAVLESEKETLRHATEAVVPPHIKQSLNKQRKQIQDLQNEVRATETDLAHANTDIRKLTKESKHLLLMQSSGKFSPYFCVCNPKYCDMFVLQNGEGLRSKTFWHYSKSAVPWKEN